MLRDCPVELPDQSRADSPCASACPAAPAPPAPSPSKPAFNALHLPVSRVLLITVVLALMGVPLLLFMAGRLQVYFLL